MAGELAYLIAPIGLDIRATHRWSERNDVCDYLSRLAPGVPPRKSRVGRGCKGQRQPVPEFLLEHLLEEANVPQ